MRIKSLRISGWKIRAKPITRAGAIMFMSQRIVWSFNRTARPYTITTIRSDLSICTPFVFEIKSYALYRMKVITAMSKKGRMKS
jgi:hypothetical protein